MSDTFRQVYAPLSDIQTQQVGTLKSMGESIESLLNSYTTENADTRTIENAKFQLEIAIMLAVKVVTSAQ